MEENIKKYIDQNDENFLIYLSNFALGKNKTLYTLDQSEIETAIKFYMKNNKKKHQ